MTAALRTSKFLGFKIHSEETNVHDYFTKTEARYWQLKHYLNFRLKEDEKISPWNTVNDDWQRSLLFIFKDYGKKVPPCVSSFCKELYNISNTFEGAIVRESCEISMKNFTKRTSIGRLQKGSVNSIQQYFLKINFLIICGILQIND